MGNGPRLCGRPRTAAKGLAGARPQLGGPSAGPDVRPAENVHRPPTRGLLRGLREPRVGPCEPRGPRPLAHGCDWRGKHGGLPGEGAPRSHSSPPRDPRDATRSASRFSASRGRPRQPGLRPGAAWSILCSCARMGRGGGQSEPSTPSQCPARAQELEGEQPLSRPLRPRCQWRRRGLPGHAPGEGATLCSALVGPRG